MKKLLLVLFISYSANAYANAPKIIETDTGITVEYTGEPSDNGSGVENPSAASSGIGNPSVTAIDADMTRLQYLTAQIDQLKKDAEEILKLSGTETAEELAAKSALADDKNHQIGIYREEMRQIADSARQKIADVARPNDGPPLIQQNLRQERKREVRELKALRRLSALSAISE
jgi:hypothetical protein